MLDGVPNMAIPNLEIVMDLGSSDLGWAVFRDGKMVVIPVVLDRGKMQPMLCFHHLGEVGTSEVPPVQSRIGLGCDVFDDILDG